MDCMIAQHYKPSSAANYFRPDATGRGGGSRYLWESWGDEEGDYYL